MEIPQVVPGHFELPLSINRNTVDLKRLIYKQSVLQCYLNQKRQQSERHAIRNLLGLIAAQMEHYDEAMGHFMRVTSDGEDMCNLNAYANMKSVCEIQYRFREAASHESKVTEYSNLASTEDGDILVSMQHESRKCHARCMAEQAYAIAYDLDDMQEYDGPRYHRAYDMYKEAMEIGQEEVDLEERADWEFNLGVVCYNIGVAMKDNFEEQEQYEEYLEESLWSFFITCKVEDTNMVSVSWSYIVAILQHCRSANQSVPRWIRDDELVGYWDDPVKCMHKAEQINSDNVSLLTRHATVIQTMSLDKALEILDKVILVKDKNVLKRDAYSMRGHLRTEKYRAQVDEYRAFIHQYNDDEGITEEQLSMIPHTEPDRDLLYRAKEDFETTLQISVQPRDLAGLGEVWHLLGKDGIGDILSTDSDEDDHDQGSQVEDNLNNALMYFTRAAGCMDGALDSQINFLRGCCLYDADEKEAALESFKQAMECQPIRDKNIDNFGWLMLVYLSLIEDNIQDERSQKRLLSEMVYWSEIAISTYGAHDVRQYILATDQWYDMPQAVNVFVEFCKSNNHPKAEFVFSAAKMPLGRKQPKRRLHTPLKTRRLKSVDNTPVNATCTPPTPPSAPPELMNQPFGCEYGTPHRPRDDIKDNEPVELCNIQRTDDNDFNETKPVSLVDASGDRDTANIAVKQPDEDQVVTVDEIRADEIVEPPEKARFNGYEYDFFVMYAPSSADWVDYNLLPKLERTQRLKGCTKDRDFIAGRHVVDNYSRCIEHSAVVLLIITEEIEKRADYCLSIRYALTPIEGRPMKPVIPVLKQQCNIPWELRHITPFDATGVVNWNKMHASIKELVEGSSGKC